MNKDFYFFLEIAVMKIVKLDDISEEKRDRQCNQFYMKWFHKKQCIKKIKYWTYEYSAV